jgi:hypothetical protein
MKPLQSNKMEAKNSYKIHDNGCRPFKVIILGNKIEIWTHDIDPAELLFTFISDDVFIGKSHLTEMTEYSGGHGDRYDGNTVLISQIDNTYIFVGMYIFSFKARTRITEYVSLVGNNDVPYPYAIDEDKNYYLLIEDVMIVGRPSILSDISKYDNPYDYYYVAQSITESDRDIKHSVIKNFHDITEFGDTEDNFNLTYHPRPEKDYDRLTREGERLYICTSEGKKELDKATYCEILLEFGEISGFAPLDDVVQLRKRRR